MPKRLKKASKPIENDDNHEISDSQKKHYEKLGYRPYLSHAGKVKWLSYEQHIYEKIKYSDQKKLFTPHKIHLPKTKKPRSLRNWIIILRHNWLLLIIFIGIILMLMNIGQIIAYLSQI